MENAVKQAIENIHLKSKGPLSVVDCPLTINFHPDRFTNQNEPLLLAIAKTGYLQSQFETGTSNGGLTAYAGGERWLWEQRVFDGAYDNAENALRPKYGALNFRKYEFGASPRFGSAYFQLKPHILTRTTFCYPDSYFEPEDFAVFSHVQSLINKANVASEDLLDDYIEAHIHGEILLKNDIEYVVLDPIYRGTEIELQANALDVPVKWHQGFSLSIEAMQQYPNYRGQQFIELAKRLAINGKINAKIVGEAVTKLDYDEQDIKKIWHYLARFGYQS